MKPLLEGKTILLGVSGSIAVYKTVDWARALRRDGAVVRTIMTDTATRFVAPLTFAAPTSPWPARRTASFWRRPPPPPWPDWPTDWPTTS